MNAATSGADRPLILAPQLASGDTVAVVSPSWGAPAVSPRRFERALTRLREMGFRVRVMRNARLSRSWVSGTIEERVADLHDAFADQDVAAVIASIGGNHSAQLLHRLDFDLIRRNPKVFCGYSDITVLHHAIHARTGLVTFYGPAVQMDFGEWPHPFDYTVEHFRRAVCQTRPIGALHPPTSYVDEFMPWSRDTDRPRAKKAATPYVALREGVATGPLLVGCLPSAVQLLGTPWRPSYERRVLVLETPGPPYSAADADRDIWTLRNAGVLDDLAGLVVARCAGMDDAETAQLHGAVLGAVQGADFPVLANLDVGHTDPRITLPLGIRAEISGDGLTVVEAGVRPSAKPAMALR